MVAKQAPSNAQKNTAARQKNRPAMKAHQKICPTIKAYLKKPQNHYRRNHRRRNHLATKAQPKNRRSTIFQPSATTKTTNNKENG
jgi:hypothetical protein